MNVVSAGKANRDNSQDQAETVIRRLAGLTDLDYFRERPGAAKSMGIGPGQLDQLVKKARQKVASAEGKGAGILFEEITPWNEAVDGAELLDELVVFIKRFVVCERHTAEAAALWIVFTWMIDAVSVAPIANITAPMPNCGKSTLLELFEALSYRPLKSDNISPAALFRSIEKWRPTLLIDEVDAFLKDNEDARGILNSGHKRNGYVLRVVGEDHEPRRFSTWGAKALCGIGSLASTLQSRSIRLELRRKLSGEAVENLRHAKPTEIENLARKLARFSRDAESAVREARPTPVPCLNNRAQDNWEPLLAIADVAGGEWPECARRVAQTISEIEAEDSPDVATELLSDIRDVFVRQDTGTLFTADLLEELCRDEEAPWSTWNRGKPMTPRQLSSRLKDFGIRPDNIRANLTVRKGYKLEKFVNVFARYLPDLPP